MIQGMIMQIHAIKMKRQANTIYYNAETGYDNVEISKSSSYVQSNLIGTCNDDLKGYGYVTNYVITVTCCNYTDHIKCHKE